MMDRVKAKILAYRTPGGQIGSKLDGHEQFVDHARRMDQMDAELRKELRRKQIQQANERKK